jgi:putative ATP-dependent endonuclease of OLD family
MYLSKIKLWNFRKFGNDSFDLKTPNLELDFQPAVNVLIGENDSGKTSVIDSIKLLLKTNSVDWFKIEHSDFYNSSKRLRIECEFKGFKDEEAKCFTEWLTWTRTGDEAEPYLCVFLDVSRTDEKVLPADVRAGVDDEGYILTAEAREKLKTTYLRPLRDAKNELISKRSSRLSQILSAHRAFQGKDNSHQFVKGYDTLNKKVEGYFKGVNENGEALTGEQLLGIEVKTVIDSYLKQFSGRTSKFAATDNTLRSILESLSLLFEEGNNLGLGSHNLLSIACELLHLQKTNWDGLRLGLIEEIEAHLHPQVQLQVIETLQKTASGIQLIFTTHSPNIGSKVHLNNLIMFQGGQAFSMGETYTLLKSTDYLFLERFLDVTKGNLFFARGVILVEGWSEELILPALAEKINVNLTERGISVINIGSTAFLRFASIFRRKEDPQMSIPVSVVTDADVKPVEAKETYLVKEDGEVKEEKEYSQDEINALLIKAQATKVARYDGGSVKTFISPYWTLEYCIAQSPKLRVLFYKSVLQALLEQKQDEDVQKLDAYKTAIKNVEEHFSKWQSDADVIAYQICQHIIEGKTDIEGIAKEKISKSIIAQCFARNLQSTSIEDIETETSIHYLLNAVKYAANN